MPLVSRIFGLAQAHDLGAEQRRDAGDDQGSAEEHVEQAGSGRGQASRVAHDVERRDGPGHAADGEEQDDAPLDRLAGPVNRGSDRLRHRSVEEVGADRGCRVEAEQQHQQRSDQRAASDPGQADEHADQEPGDGIERIISGEDRGSPLLERIERHENAVIYPVGRCDVPKHKAFGKSMPDNVARRRLVFAAVRT